MNINNTQEKDIYIKEHRSNLLKMYDISEIEDYEKQLNSSSPSPTARKVLAQSIINNIFNKSYHIPDKDLLYKLLSFTRYYLASEIYNENGRVYNDYAESCIQLGKILDYLNETDSLENYVLIENENIPKTDKKKIN